MKRERERERERDLSKAEHVMQIRGLLRGSRDLRRLLVNRASQSIHSSDTESCIHSPCTYVCEVFRVTRVIRAIRAIQIPQTHTSSRATTFMLIILALIALLAITLLS